jgi:hypothetical protein
MACIKLRSNVAPNDGPDGKFVGQRVTLWLSRTQVAKSLMLWMQLVPQ